MTPFEQHAILRMEFSRRAYSDNITYGGTIAALRGARSFNWSDADGNLKIQILSHPPYVIDTAR